MVSTTELKARVQEFLRFNKQEVSGLVVAILVTAFIFSFRDWGAETFDLAIGLKNLTLMIFATSLSFIFRLSCQKIYGLTEGYKAEFKVWWAGLAIALGLAFISLGRIPVVIIGSMVTIFMIKHRLGEFRYGFSYWNNAMIALWGILGTMIMAILFAIGLYFFPQNYFFHKGLILNIIMGYCALIPIPQLDGLHIFFGSRGLYLIGIATVILGTILLLSRTKIGLILAIIIGASAAIIYLIIGSEK